MRLTLVAKPFDDPDYIFELKHDGFRAIAYIENSKCELVSRNQNHFSLKSLKESLAWCRRTLPTMFPAIFS